MRPTRWAGEYIHPKAGIRRNHHGEPEEEQPVTVLYALPAESGQGGCQEHLRGKGVDGCGQGNDITSLVHERGALAWKTVLVSVSMGSADFAMSDLARRLMKEASKRAKYSADTTISACRDQGGTAITNNHHMLSYLTGVYE